MTGAAISELNEQVVPREACTGLRRQLLDRPPNATEPRDIVFSTATPRRTQVCGNGWSAGQRQLTIDSVEVCEVVATPSPYPSRCLEVN